MAVAAASRPVPDHGPGSPRSPVLSDAGMILPDQQDRSHSPNPYIQRPPSPPVLYNDIHHTSHVKLASVPHDRRRAPQHTKSPPLSAQSSRSTLRNMGDSNGGAARRSPARDNNPLASSPTIQNGLSSDMSPKDFLWAAQNGRRSSVASSLRSEDFENWPGFDSQYNFEDSGLGLEEQEEKRDQFPGDAETGDEMDGERWPNQHHSSGSDESDDPYSSAGLSRRAEIILANAKKRLNVCEHTSPDFTLCSRANIHRSWRATCEARESRSWSLPPSTVRGLLPICRNTSRPGANETAGCMLDWGLSHRACLPYDPLHSRPTEVQPTHEASARRRFHCPLPRPHTCHAAPPISGHRARLVTRPGLGRLGPLDRVAFPSKSRAVTRCCATHATLPASSNRSILSGLAHATPNPRRLSKRCRKMMMIRECVDRRQRRVDSATR